MVTVRIDLSPDGLLRGFWASGHAGGAAGRNVACAAVTALLRTAAHLFAERGFLDQGDANGPGDMRVRLSRKTEAEAPDWLGGVTEFLLKGLGDLQSDYPREIVMRIERDRHSSHRKGFRLWEGKKAVLRRMDAIRRRRGSG